MGTTADPGRRLASVLRKFTPGRIAVGAQVLASMAAAWAALRVLPYARALDVFEPPQGRPRRSATYRLRVLRMTDTFGRWMFGEMPCLPQALAARWILGRAGYPTALRIGVDPEKVGRAPFAHAWLEEDGRIVLGGHASGWRYLPFKPVAAPSEPHSP